MLDSLDKITRLRWNTKKSENTGHSFIVTIIKGKFAVVLFGGAYLLQPPLSPGPASFT